MLDVRNLQKIYTGRNRNVLIANSHVYENRGVGIYLDDVNLHQINVTGCHVSYCDDGGIVAKAGQVRNLHVTGCDIESNQGAKRPPTANVLIDSTGGSNAEVAITGNRLHLLDTREGRATLSLQADDSLVERNTLVLVTLIVLQLVIPGINRYFIAPPQILSYTAGVNLSPTDRLIVYGSTRPSNVFYARRKVIFVSEGEEATIQQALTQPGQTMVVLPETFQSKLPPEANTLVPILKQHGYVLLANRPMVAIPEQAQAPPKTSPH